MLFTLFYPSVNDSGIGVIGAPGRTIAKFNSSIAHSLRSVHACAAAGTTIARGVHANLVSLISVCLSEEAATQHLV